MMEERKAGTKDAILASSRELFWKHGFRRVTVDEICEKTGISKMTFYRYFANKTELAKAVFSQAANEGYDQFRIIMN
jgi:AcrR family transcriptional regulator